MTRRPSTLLSVGVIAGGLAWSAAAGNAPAGHPTAAESASCSRVVASVEAAQSAVASAKPGRVVCMADGAYGRVSLSASKAAPGVTLRAQHAGRATLHGASLAGSHLRLARFVISGDEVTLRPGSDHMSVEHNRITGGYFGVDAGPTSSTNVSDVTIRGNDFVGPFGEDALRINRYHDGPDRDHHGILIAGNEISGVRENGNHSDCLQSVWGGDHLYFTGNYLHDNRCQGFFVKDQPATVRTVVVENNLFLRNAEPCGGPGGCGQPAVIQVFGPIDGLTFRRNTVWTPGGRSPLALREAPWGRLTIERNVIYRGWSDAGGISDVHQGSNVVCQWEGTLPRLSGSRRSCNPGFVNAARDDYRLRGHRTAGITWRPAARHFGP
jgi:Right handed beta helix region